MRKSKKKWLDFAVLLLTMETNNARVTVSANKNKMVKVAVNGEKILHCKEENIVLKAKDMPKKAKIKGLS